jgi:polysaccharide biosynthesis protein PslG
MKALLASLLFVSSAYAKIPDFQEFGVNTHGAMGSQIDIIADMGATWVRNGVPWFELEPAQGNYDWSYLDIMLPDLKRRGMKILFVLAYAPSFHSSNGMSNGIPNVQAWKNFVDAITTRYRDEVDAWEVWNEPNLGEFFVGTPRQYFDYVLKPVYSIIKNNDPDSLVAAPGLATLYSTKWWEFLKKLNSYGGGAYFDVLSHHAYNGEAKGMKVMLTQSRAGKPSIQKALKDSKFDKKPFWLTEWGCDGVKIGDFWQAHCLYEQAKMFGTISWVQKVFVYCLNEDPRYVDKFQWGLLDVDYRPKRAVTQLKAWIKY